MLEQTEGSSRRERTATYWIAAGLLVAVRPRWGAPVVAAWLLGIIVNLLTLSGYYDVALRDFGLMLGALTLARLAWTYDAPGRRG